MVFFKLGEFVFYRHLSREMVGINGIQLFIQKFSESDEK